MEKYSVLLVDDEEDVIQIIMKKMDWESMGFQIAGYAHNGVGSCTYHTDKPVSG